MVKKKKKVVHRRHHTRKKRGVSGIPTDLIETALGAVLGGAIGKYAELQVDKSSTTGPINQYYVATGKVVAGAILAAMSTNAVVKGIGYGLIADGAIDGTAAIGGYKSFGIPAYVAPVATPVTPPKVSGTPGMRRLAGTPGMRILNGANPAQGGIMGDGSYPRQGGLMGVNDNGMQEFSVEQTDDWSLEGNN